MIGWILQILAENMLVFKFLSKILGKCDADRVVLLIMEENDNFNIHKKKF